MRQSAVITTVLLTVVIVGAIVAVTLVVPRLTNGTSISTVTITSISTITSTSTTTTVTSACTHSLTWNDPNMGVYPNGTKWISINAVVYNYSSLRNGTEP